jgi:F420-dependent oxidoreductase-like protein
MMRIGLQLPSFSWPGGSAEIAPRLIEIAQSAEAAGFASLWVMDHFFQLPDWGSLDDPMLESYTTLGYLAAATKKIRLGAMVTGVIYRFPGVLVKTASTLDVLSGGRTYLGLGAGWYRREAVGLGIPFPPLAERFARLEETLQIVRQMWAGEVQPYAGSYYQLAEPHNAPQPLAQPHPSILIGGNGEQKTMRLVAQYADACNLLVLEPEEIRGKLAMLKKRCEEIGRDYAEIEKTCLNEVNLAPGAMIAGDIVSLCRALAGAGIEHVIVNMPDAHELRPLEIFGREIIPEVAAF